MGWKYEVAVWTRTGKDYWDYHNVYEGNNILMAYFKLLKNHKYGARRLIIR